MYEGGSYLIDKGHVREINARFAFQSLSDEWVEIYNTHGNINRCKGVEIEQKFFSNSAEKSRPLKELESVRREQEIIDAVTLALWNKMRATKCCGFFIPLSGGADSALTAYFIYKFAQKIVKEREVVRKEFESITGIDVSESTAEDVVNQILFTFYLPMNFSGSSQKLSHALAKRINSKHFDFSIQDTFDNVKS